MIRWLSTATFPGKTQPTIIENMEMRHLLSPLLLISLLFTGCRQETIPLVFEGPDGPMTLTATYYPNPSDVKDCFGVISHTEGRDVFSSMWLDFYAKDKVRPGQELRFEKLMFGAPLSSDSRNYADSHTGKMILLEKTQERIVIRMEDVRFTILHGEYTLSGDLVALAKKEK